MKTSHSLPRDSMKNPFWTAVSLAVLLLAGAASVDAQQTSGVLPRKASPYGKTYGEWSALWTKWLMELPPGPGHPAVDDPTFNVATGQSGHVWYLAAPFGTIQRTCTIPIATSLFVGVITAEASDLEGLGDTEAERRATAEFLADHMLNPFCIIDGATVSNIAGYRVSSPQFDFTAPTPWIFGDVGGAGTSVSDGYFVMLAPLSAGPHTLRFGGSFHFSIAEGDPFDFDASIDITYHLTVQ